MPPKTSGTHYGGGHHGQGQRGLLDDFTGVKKHAKQHAGDSGDDSMFSSALNMLQEKQGSLQNESVDEEHAVNSHQSFFGSGGSSGGESTSSGMGAAAAMQALKMYSSGSSSSSSSEGGGSSQEFMGMAMGQAAKLFDQQKESGNVSSDESKESVVQSAGEMALKMYMQSQMGGSSSGGLMSMASKFM